MEKRTKDDVQKAARAAWDANRCWGLLDIATGVGKSKIAVDASFDIVQEIPIDVKTGDVSKIYLVVPTRKLRDKNWPKEFDKWDKLDVWENNVTRICYASAHKIKGARIELLILDEGHNLTERAAYIILNNDVRRIMVLTATAPKAKGSEADKLKDRIFKYFKIRQLYYYSLDEALRDGLISNFELRIVECTLDNKTKYIKGGNKKKGYFYQTEYAAYHSMSKFMNAMFAQGKGDFAAIMRSKLVKSFKSKQEVARIILQKHIKPGERCIIFCGSIEQAEELLKGDTYHSKRDDTALELFMNLEIDRLGVVDALNEGHNIPCVDSAVIVQLSASDRELVQRVGRVVRLRDDPDHLAVIWILVVIGTADEEWFKSAIKPFSPDNITYFHWKNVVK